MSLRKRIALVREPSPSFPACITAYAFPDTINYQKAKKQHIEYCNTLEELGLEVIKLPPEKKYPDSCFVEDAAIIHGKRALISHFGALSRRGEEKKVLAVLSQTLKVKKCLEPATIEGGDVIHFSNHLISGITQRSNYQGIQQLATWLGVEIKTIEDHSIVHLKSYITALNETTIITINKYVSHPELSQYNKLVLDDKDAYAANTLTINDSVLIPAGYPAVTKMIKEQGFEAITLDITEFQKCEGALTCLSLLY